MTLPRPKVWFITGCSSGFGRALAETVLETGAIVWATSRSVDRLEDLEEKYPNTCRVAILDVTNSRQIEEVISSLIAKDGYLDVVVNNAGYGLIGPLEESTDSQIERNFATIVFGAIHLFRAVLPTLRAQRSGRIINISAAAAIANYAGFSIYGGAKCALEGLSEGLHAEVKPLGIKVSIVQPGPFRTEFISRSLEKTTAALGDYAGSVGKFGAFLQKIDGQQPGDPRKAAEAILKLSELENPPLRLTLGRYAWDKADRVAKARLRELESFKELSQSTEFKV